MFIEFLQFDKECQVIYSKTLPNARAYVSGSNTLRASNIGSQLIECLNNENYFNECNQSFFSGTNDSEAKRTIDWLRWNMDVLISGKYLLESNSNNKVSFIEPYEYCEPDNMYSETKELLFNIGFSLNNDNCKPFKNYMQVEAKGCYEACAIEFIKYVEMIHLGIVKQPQSCDLCKKIFIPKSRSDQIYCSFLCREETFKQKSKGDPYYLKYRNLCSNISRTVDKNDTAYGEWKIYAENEYKDVEKRQLYNSAEAYGTAMRKKWNEMKSNQKGF